MLKEELICKKLESEFSQEEIENKILNKEKGYEIFLYSEEWDIRRLVVKQFSQKEIIENLKRARNEDILIELLRFLERYDLILEILSEHKEWYIREAVASNPNASKEILERLSKDIDNEVKTTVAKHQKCSKKILERLSKEEWTRIRIEIIENKNCPNKILKALSKDKNEYVRQIANRKLSLR